MSALTCSRIHLPSSPSTGETSFRAVNLPWGVGHFWGGDGARKTEEFRAALKEICENSEHKNVHYVHGPDLLSFSGLYHDMLHPSDMGMIEMATQLVPKIRAVLENQPQ